MSYDSGVGSKNSPYLKLQEREWWPIPQLWRLRQADHQGFQVNLGYIVSSRLS